MREKESKIMRLRRKLQGARGVCTRYWETERLQYKAGTVLKKERAREMEMESGRERLTHKQEMREMARGRV